MKLNTLYQLTYLVLLIRGPLLAPLISVGGGGGLETIWRETRARSSSSFSAKFYSFRREMQASHSLSLSSFLAPNFAPSF